MRKITICVNAVHVPTAANAVPVCDSENPNRWTRKIPKAVVKVYRPEEYKKLERYGRRASASENAARILRMLFPSAKEEAAFGCVLVSGRRRKTSATFR